MPVLKNTREHGFTLVEVLVTITILGILAAIAVGVYTAHKKDSYISNMKTDLTNTAILLHQDWLDNGRVYAPLNEVGVPQERSFPEGTNVYDETVLRLKVSNPGAEKSCLVGWVNGDEHGTKWVYDMQTRALIDYNESVTVTDQGCMATVGWQNVATITG